MKKSVSILEVFVSVVLLVILFLIIILLKKVNRCCDCNQNKFSQEKVLILRTAEVYDTAHNKGTHVWIDTLSLGEKGNSSLTVWYYCPEEQIKKALTVVKKKINAATKRSVPVVKEVSVKKEASSQTNVNNVSNTIIEIPKVLDALNQSLPVIPDTLKVEFYNFIGKERYRNYYRNLVLPPSYDEKRSVLFYDYDFRQNFTLQNYIKKAKTHLWIGTGLATVGAIGFASSMFYDVPTFVEYNGLGAFDPANKYYAHNIRQRERLRTLKWVRGASVVVGVLGGADIVYGIHLLKDADFEITPESVSLKVTF
jgi:hypothetical protein